MDYERKYKEALGWMQSLYDGLHGATKEDAEHYFPELKESEDEQIREDIIRVFKGEISYTSKEANEKYIAWLEKQAKKPADMAEHKDYSSIDPHFFKPNDKVKSKFREGDWVVDSQGLAHQIERVVENVTTHTFDYDIVGGGYFNEDNEDVHLWTIQDAKDGDVLYSPCLSLLWIFKSRDTIYCGCNLNYNDGAFCGEGYFERPTDAIPATKEQRDLLFAKIKEAGYEWDAEKKELKKIHIIDEGKAEMDYCFTKMMNGEKVSPAWSEDNEDMIKSIYEGLQDLSDELGWSDFGHSSIDDIIDWLISPKGRYTWKPSDEQMKALHDLNLNISYAGQRQVLIELYNDLKKLKGE